MHDRADTDKVTATEHAHNHAPSAGSVYAPVLCAVCCVLCAVCWAGLK